MTYSIYILVEPDNTPFYVGKTKEAQHRLRGHELEARKGCACSKCDIVRSIWAQGKQVQQHIVCSVETEAEAFEQEQYFIAFFGRENLTNRADGGAGTKGRPQSDAARAKIGAALKSYFADTNWHEWFRAQMADPNRRAKISASQQANWDGNHERKNKTSGRAKAQWADPEIRARMVAKLKELRSTPEYKAAQSARMKARRAAKNG